MGARILARTTLAGNCVSKNINATSVVSFAALPTHHEDDSDNSAVFGRVKFAHVVVVRGSV
jgi:hypothetical protein